MSRLLCIDPAWSGGTPPDQVVSRTIYSGVRFVARPDLWPAVGHYLELAPDLTVALVIARESGDPAQYLDWATSDWMRPRVRWIVGNEPDGSGPSSWTMSAEEYSALWDSCRGLSGERWIAGMSSGDADLARAYLQPDAAGLNVHIYTLAPADARATVRQYQALGTSIWIGETHPADGYRLADYTWPAGVNVNDFCFSEAMVPGMGLYA